MAGRSKSPPVFALLESTDKLKGVAPVFGETYLISTKDVLEKTVLREADPDIFHVYCGYAGWTNEQLKREVDLGMWFIFHADTGMVFDSDPDSLWPRMIKKSEQQVAMRIKPNETTNPFAVVHFAVGGAF